MLACIGIYGVMGYMVTERAWEIGLRIALGARGTQIRGMVLKQGMVLALTGVVIGLVAAAGLTRILTSSLFGVSPLDPATFALVPVVLAGIAMFACYLPAQRATRVDPVKTLQDG